MNANHHVSVTALRTLPIFAALDEHRLEAIARVARMRHADRKVTVVGAGERIEHIHLILAGQVKVESSNAKGRSVILYLLEQGDLFGEMEVIDERPATVTVTAVEPCDLVVIGKEDFRLCMAENFDVSRYVMRNLVRRMRQADNKIASLAGLDVHDRVASLLQDLSESREGRRVVPRRISRADIARMIGASREMVSRVMRDLQARGMISEADGVIRLHGDPSRDMQRAA
jgi:CRP/FNR family cyclic AMP-dependent transcriptional regulator